MKKIIITTGDPAGIGPEIASKHLRFHRLDKNIIYLIYGKLILFNDGNKVQKINRINQANEGGKIYWLEIDTKVDIGKISKKSGAIAYNILQKCRDDIKSNSIAAVVTCPVSKAAIQLTNPEFIGHTEFFGEVYDNRTELMSFWGRYFNLVLLSTHDSIKNIINNFNPNEIEKKLKNIHKEISKYIWNPRIAILSINPHAGENGAFGTEDEQIKNIVGKLSDNGILIEGPFPADTFFVSKVKEFDFVISLFHDQGLIPFKMLTNDAGVNVTLGLPFIRTSVDHGTAFDIAGKNIASEKSFAQALNFAENFLFEKKSSPKIYSAFAKYYDDHMKYVEYTHWIEFILRKYNEITGKTPKYIAEMACGTGNIANNFSAMGFEVDGFDISAEMLKIASRKSDQTKFYLADFRETIIEEKYDLVLNLFDSINYCKTRDELLSTIHNAYHMLRKSGLFIFDISTLLNCRENFDGFVDLKDDPDNFMIHQSFFDEEDSVLNTHLTFFYRKGFLFERSDEYHRQKIFSSTEIINLIKRTPFELYGIFDLKESYKLSPLHKDIDNEYSRLFFILRK